MARRFSSAQLMEFMKSMGDAAHTEFALRPGVPAVLLICTAPISAFVGRAFDHDVVHLLTAMYSSQTAVHVGDVAHRMWVRRHYAPCTAFMRSMQAPPPLDALWVGYWAAGVECRRQIAIMSWAARVPRASQKPLRRLRALLADVWPMFGAFTANIVRAEAQVRLDALGP
jgi:hypothetical protein